MNTDIRVLTTFPHHHKTKKLRRKLGPEGVCALIFLWLFAAENRPDGVLSGMDEDDICIAAQWDGDAQSMLGALLEVGFLELVEGAYVIHDWLVNNPWAASAPARKAKAEHAAKARWEKRNAISNNIDARSMEMDAASTNEQCSKMPVADFSNAPSPNPSPSPIPKSKKQKPAETDPADQSPPVASLKVGFDYATGKFLNMNGLYQVWCDAYPAVDVMAELKRMAAWLISNPKHKKSDIGRFVNNWLSKQQDAAIRAPSGRVVSGQQPVTIFAPAMSPDRRDAIRRTLAELDGGKC